MEDSGDSSEPGADGNDGSAAPAGPENETPGAQDKKGKPKSEEPKAQTRLERVLLWISVPAAFAAILGTVINYYQLQEMKKAFLSDRPYLAAQIQHQEIMNGRIPDEERMFLSQPPIVVVIRNAGRQPALIEQLQLGVFHEVGKEGVDPHMMLARATADRSARVVAMSVNIANLTDCKGLDGLTNIQNGESVVAKCTLNVFFASQAKDVMTNRRSLYLIFVAVYRSPVGNRWETAITLKYVPPRLGDLKDFGLFVPISDPLLSYDREAE